MKIRYGQVSVDFNTFGQLPIMLIIATLLVRITDFGRSAIGIFGNFYSCPVSRGDRDLCCNPVGISVIVDYFRKYGGSIWI